MDEYLYTLKEAAKILTCSAQTLKRGIKKNKIDAVKKEHNKRFSYYLTEGTIRDYALKKGKAIDENLFKSMEVTDELKEEDAEIKAIAESIIQSSKPEIQPSPEKQSLEKEEGNLKEENHLIDRKIEDLISEVEILKAREENNLKNQAHILKEKEDLEAFLKEIEESMLQMTEQYKELAEQTMERDRKLEHLKKIIDIKDEELKQTREELESFADIQKDLNDIKLKYDEEKIDFESIKAEKDALKNQLREVENVVLHLTEQYKVLANLTFERDKKIEELSSEVSNYKSILSLKEQALESEKEKLWWDKLLGN